MKVSITRFKLDDLAMSISTKSGVPVPMTLTEMVEAVDGMSADTETATYYTGSGEPTASTGSDGDVYLKTTAVYQKVNGAWVEQSTPTYDTEKHYVRG